MYGFILFIDTTFREVGSSRVRRRAIGRAEGAAGCAEGVRGGRGTHWVRWVGRLLRLAAGEACGACGGRAVWHAGEGGCARGEGQ